ncbi:hypothetical protein [Mesorhizobium sp.]|uniref:hypothetical protein n=1 Tax=Mesorhizobium sp. TaxID=1871066 RepID=UPI000FE8F03E|nr:hypothetical protein [Mesorhizobium sp.]RWP31942.1 MAG: hypothetical protein EOR03_21680 [Mesorhizobium sp.]
MTGFNHYSNCTCGWCVNNGRSRINRGQLLNDLRRQDALSFLKRNSANSIAGCYVNPNARCPVCGTAVFFYSNQFGSKVYFDDLGPPWPKHPCTDNPRRRIESTGSLVGTPSRRAIGLSQELVSAARTAGLFRDNAYNVGPKEWQLLVVIAIDRNVTKNVVFAEFLDAGVGATTRFTYFSEVPLFEVGDFVSKKGDQISFLHRDTLNTVTFKEGSTVRPVPPDAPVRPSPTVKAAPVLIAKTARIVPSPSKPALPSKYDMTTAEMVHYHSKKISVADFCDKLEPIVKTYARAGTRKPRDVAARLNADGHRTANGSRWTPRLTHFLLGLIFLEPTSPETKRGSIAPLTTTPGEQAPTDKTPLTQTEMARRLSALGRVVVKEK